MAYSNDDPHFQRLTEVADWSYTRQRPDRQVHQFLVRHLLGEYHPSVSEDKIPTSIPLLSMACRSMSRSLVSKAPRILVQTQARELKSWSENSEISANKRIQRSNLARELRECANQSMISFGVMFTAPCYVGTPDGMKLDLEFRAVDRADYFYDTKSATLEEADLQGHDFDMPLIDVREHPLFDEHCRGEVNADGARESAVRDESTNVRRDGSRPQDLYDYVRIRCVYERRRNKLYYYPRHQPELKLAEIEWLGPRHGPYRYLYYEKIPGNAVPMSPAMHLIKKHRSFNMLDIKAIHQQQVQKNLLIYTSGSKEEAERVINAVNNQSTLQDNGAVRMGSYGGADQGTVSMAQMQKADFSYAAGNLEQYAGLASQAPTLGQERLLAGSSSAMLDDMSGWAYQFVRGLCQDIFWFDLHDPNPQPQTFNKPIEGTDLFYPVEWTKEHRAFAMEMEFDVDVVPFSYVEKSPQSILADQLAAMQIMMQLRQDMAAQGMSIDAEAIFRDIAKLKDLPGLYDWFILNQDPERLSQLLSPRTGAQPTDPAKPNGNYKRESTSDGAGQMMEMLRGVGKGSESREMQAV